MVRIFEIVGILSVLALVFLGSKSLGAEKEKKIGPLTYCFGMLMLGLGMTFGGAQAGDVSRIGAGIGYGALIAMAALFLETGPACAVGILTAFVGAFHNPFYPSGPMSGWASGAGGLVLAVWVLSAWDKKLVVSGGAAGLAFLGSGALIAVYDQMNGAKLVIPAAAAIVFGYAILQEFKLNAMAKSGVLILLAAIAGYAGTAQAVIKEDAKYIVIAAAILAAAMMLFSQMAKRLPSIYLSAIIWAALGSLAYGFGGAAGVCAAAPLALVMAAAAGSSTGFAAILPLAALGLMRGFKDSCPANSLILELTHHYSLLGILIGCLAAAALAKHLSETKPDQAPLRQALVIILGLTAAGLFVAYAPIALGQRAVVGLFIGAALGGLLHSVNDTETGTAVSASSVCISAVIAAYPAISDKLDLTKDEKLGALGAAAVVGALALIGSWMLTQRHKDSSASIEASA